MRRLPAVGDRAWAVYLACGVLVVIAYYISVANAADAVTRVVLYNVVSTSSAAAVLYACYRYRPKPLLPWLLLGLSEAVYAAADISFYTTHLILGITDFPALADVFYISHYALVVAGLLLLIRLRTPGGDLPSLLDAAVIAVVAGMLSWLYLIAPQTHSAVPGLVKVVTVAYPMMDLAMFAVALRLILGRGRRPMSFYLLSLNLLAFLTADSVYVYQQMIGTYQAGNFLDAIWLTGNLALGAAALHPTMRRLGDPPESHWPIPGPLRTAAMCTAALVAPATLLVQYARGYYRDVPVIGVACALLFILTIVRLVGLVAEQRRLAITDSLTGLRTRRYFETRLSANIARARKADSSVAILIADVDHFKSINDAFGHPDGDRVLIEIASRLRRATRSGDLLARYGGEEFAVLVPGTEGGEPAVIAERLRNEVAKSPIQLSDGKQVDVTISVGTASYPLHGQTQLDLVSTADRALYAAKAHGRNQTVVGPATTTSAAADMLVYLRHASDVVDGWISGYEHGSAVGRWAGQVATYLGQDPASVRCAEIGGRLHDVGKILVSEEVWTKSTPLTEEERALIKRHPEDGYRMVRTIPGLLDVAMVIRQHHERFDGAGYPQGLSGTEIRLEARIVAVCDSWAAMLANRPYHKSLTEEDARLELQRCQGTQFDPVVVEAFLHLHSQGRLGDLAERYPSQRIDEVAEAVRPLS